MEIKTEFQKLKEKINSMDRPFENYDLCGCNDMSPNTLRKTVRWFMKAGYIDRIDRGVYKRIKTIPEELSSTDLEREGYGSREKVFQFNKIEGEFYYGKLTEE